MSPVTVEAVELIKSSIQMINCELLSQVYVAAPPILRSCAYLDSLRKFGFRAWIRSQK